MSYDMERVRRLVRAKMDISGKITMAKVAECAGVSRSAVSAAFSDRPTTVGLNPATRAQIRKIAAELGYRPNILSRSFIKQRSYLVSMLGSESFFLFALETIKGTEDILDLTEYSLLTFYNGSRAADQTKHLQKSISRRVDGIIIVGAAEEPTGPNHRLIEQLRNQGTPIVQIYRRQFTDVPVVMMDDEQAGYLAARHLIDLGHRRIAHVTNECYRDEQLPGNEIEARLRSEGYLRAVREAGIEPLIFTYNPYDPIGSPIGGQEPLSNDYTEFCAQPARQLALSKPRITGVTTFNDYAAIGLVHNLEQMGIRVPADVSVVGYDNIETGALARPSLTSVRPKLFDIGRLAAKMILEMMDGQAVDDVVLEPELVVRASTASPHVQTNQVPANQVPANQVPANQVPAKLAVFAKASLHQTGNSACSAV